MGRAGESPLLAFKDAHGRRYRCRLVLAEGARPPVRVVASHRCCWPCFTLDVPGTDTFVASQPVTINTNKDRFKEQGARA